MLAEMDVVMLSRIQFALTIMFHYLFPPLTIGLGVIIAWLEGMFLWKKEQIYMDAARFWTGIFGVNFAIGVATGIVMEFEFGTNWAMYSRFVGDVFGSALAAEGIFAFFLESGFLAILVYGHDRVSPAFHFFAACMVALGSIFSSVWITIANSWQQTPAGHEIVQMTRNGEPWFVDGQPIMRAEIVDFWAMVFNPSTMHRLIHVWLGCFIMGACLVLSISAWYLIRGKHEEFAKKSLTGGLFLCLFSCLAMFVSGHFQAKMVYEHQPAKLAAFEGHFETGPAGMSLVGIPNEETESIDMNVEVPGALSFLVHEDFNEDVIGLDKFKPEDRPPVKIPYFAYHIMIGTGVSLTGLMVLSTFWLWRGTLFDKRWVMWLFVISIVPAIAGNEAGWVATEVGRQPWIVQAPLKVDESGVRVEDESGQFIYESELGLRTNDAVSKAITSEQVLTSIIMFGAIYFLLGILWLFVLNRKIQAGPPHKDDSSKSGNDDLAEALTGHHSLTEGS
ncbi:cytochrome ubiquinol oxidase subunit I [Mariniblastus fucicola]|uniref:Cytochrome bd-I ubiquinol oxidase subunit 1 n=1 Tax=Mariniblastus fucicola TaxID=980251 RepID=A0A5B9PEU8_9BACT|nr:cytochrome ubiquinol oxidase subunit I [Mariniblastus fucicola]QEG23725.1 Cytochrome bd-I ubiquinol oxidase subunit 1 [Mariniblastus fucicola]